jgi:hypothetical protein
MLKVLREWDEAETPDAETCCVCGAPIAEAGDRHSNIAGRDCHKACCDDPWCRIERGDTRVSLAESELNDLEYDLAAFVYHNSNPEWQEHYTAALAWNGRGRPQNIHVRWDPIRGMHVFTYTSTRSE